MEHKKMHEQIYDIIASIPEGRVTTYGAVAHAVGRPSMARFITGIIRIHPDAHALPWHRVVYSDGRIWQKNAAVDSKRLKLYEHEGIDIVDGKIQNFNDVIYRI